MASSDCDCTDECHAGVTCDGDMRYAAEDGHLGLCCDCEEDC